MIQKPKKKTLLFFCAQVGLLDTAAAASVRQGPYSQPGVIHLRSVREGAPGLEWPTPTPFQEHMLDIVNTGGAKLRRVFALLREKKGILPFAERVINAFNWRFPLAAGVDNASSCEILCQFRDLLFSKGISRLDLFPSMKLTTDSPMHAVSIR
jgi:hypothetical protein